MSEEDDAGALAGKPAQDHRVSDPVHLSEPGLRACFGDVAGDFRFFPDRTLDFAEKSGPLGEHFQEPAHTDTPKSRSAWLSVVLRSVLSLRLPMMSAQGVRYSPAGNLRGLIPGMTTLRAGMRPCSFCSAAPVTSMMGVEAVRTTPAPRTA